jgi:hypothetical protein
VALRRGSSRSPTASVSGMFGDFAPMSSAIFQRSRGQSRTRSRWFLDGLELDAASLVVAQAARLAARRLDRADARTTSPLAERLVALCQQLSLKHRVLMRSTPW